MFREHICEEISVGISEFPLGKKKHDERVFYPPKEVCFTCSHIFERGMSQDWYLRASPQIRECVRAKAEESKWRNIFL